jgi:hypothetical protein
MTTDTPPFGRSTTSTVSPLLDEAYLLVFETAIFTSINEFYNKYLSLSKEFAPMG